MITIYTLFYHKYIDNKLLLTFFPNIINTQIANVFANILYAIIHITIFIFEMQRIRALV